MAKDPYDLCIIGGGINGCGIARDAAGRGLSVLLLEKGDLAQATSSASTKLIHGGLRYLEHYEFKLVRDSLKEREVLMGMAPHIIWPLTFVLPHQPHLRPSWLIRMGLFLYDNLGGRKKLHGSRGVNLRKHLFGMPLHAQFEKGFSYADCWVEDSRLVVLNAMDAHARGADILTRTACTDLTVENGLWQVEAGRQTFQARKIVNAAGPWVRSFLDANKLSDPQTMATRLVKGSHIIVPRLYDGEQCYILQQADGRIVFAIPYEQKFTLIGTTDVEYQGDPDAAKISEEEILYLCESINQHFRASITSDDVVSTYSGVRPLLDDGGGEAAGVTRDYKLSLEAHDGAEILNIFGGKLTTYRTLSEKAVNRVAPGTKPWTAGADLPGGDIPDDDFETFVAAQTARYATIPPETVRRLCRAYGTRIAEVLSGGKVGPEIGDGLYEAEVLYLIKKEWAHTADDILWRRSKLGLHVSGATDAALRGYLNDYHAGRQSHG